MPVDSAMGSSMPIDGMMTDAQTWFPAKRTASLTIAGLPKQVEATLGPGSPRFQRQPTWPLKLAPLGPTACRD